MSPEPLLSRTAHQKITFMQGNAAELPFPDRSFDLVYTVHALEQMDEIAPKALSEIARVAKKRVIFIEPFRD